MELTLYGTSACHLCDLAEQVLQHCQSQGVPLLIHKVDISDSDELFERYGVRIPVVRDAAGRELGWPFDVTQCLAWLEAA